MRRVERAALSKKARVWLWRHTRAVLTAPEPRATAAERWKARRPFDRRYQDEIRRTLKRMAGGVERCMYCEEAAGHPIEHFWPKSRYPERAFCWDNLLLACDHCNNRCKGQQFPLDERGEPLLVDPTAEDPALHLELRPREGLVLPRHGSRKGQTTIDILQLNRRYPLVEGRKNAWLALQVLVASYARDRAQGRHDRAELSKQCICAHPFPAVLEFLLRVLDRPDAPRYIASPECLAALRRHRDELSAWLRPQQRPRDTAH